MKRNFLIGLVVFTVVAVSALSEETITLRDIADTNISSHPSEKDFNYGKSSRLRLKGHEMMMLVKFDVAPIQGWTVSHASLFLHVAGPHRLKTIGLSTIAVDWIEGEGRGNLVPRGATFTWADFGKQRWGGSQSDFTDAALTAQGTKTAASDVKQLDGGWLEIDVPPDIVHALINGDSFGLAIVDEKGQTRANNDVHSREQSGFEPYLSVTGNRTDATPATRRVANPPAVAQSHPKPLEPTKITQLQKREPVLRGGKLRVWAYSDCEKADPITGNLLAVGQGGTDYWQANTVWDGTFSTVHLSAARNEFVAFHLCLETTSGLQNIRVAGAVPDVSVRLFKDWYVRDRDWHLEVAVPIEGPFSIPDSRN